MPSAALASAECLGVEVIEQPALFGREVTGSEQVRPAVEGAAKGFAEPPSSDRAVVTRDEDVRYRLPLEGWRARVLRILEQTVGERLLRGRLRLDRPGQEADHGVDDHERRQLAAGQDIVADRELEV